MKPYIIAVCIINCTYDKKEILICNSPAEALSAIIDWLDADLQLHTGKEKIASEDNTLKFESLRALFDKKEGKILYEPRGGTYSISFKVRMPEANISSEEMFSFLDHYCNYRPSTSNYRETAKAISETMHRAVQNELWRFLKEIIRAIASGRYDERNALAHRQCEKIVTLLDHD